MLDDAIIEAVAAGVKQIASSGARSAARQTTVHLLNDLAPEVAGALFGGIAKALLSLLIKKQDRGLESLEKIVRAPFMTGVRIAHETLSVAWHDSDSRQFFEQRLAVAIAELDRALTLCGDQGRNQEREYILLVQGVCYREIRGASAFAKRAFDELSAEVVKRKQALEQLAAARRVEASQLLRQASSLREYESVRTTDAFDDGLGRMPMSVHIERARSSAWRERRRLEAAAAKLSLEQRKLNESAERLTAVLQAIGHWSRTAA